jgi:hypothetical protein
MSYFSNMSLSAVILLGSAIAVPAQGYDDRRQPGVAPTQSKVGPASGSQNMSSTGWTGGEGSTHMDVTHEGPPESGQPEVAKGHDLKGGKGQPEDDGAKAEQAKRAAGQPQGK